MKKIPTIYLRDQNDLSRVTTIQNPDCDWVFRNEGRITRKWDGTAILVKDGVFHARFDAKRGRTTPDGWFEAQSEPDPESGSWPGWYPVDLTIKEHRRLVEAIENYDAPVADGTYELIGPKVNKNADRWPRHELLTHGLNRINPEDAERVEHLNLAGEITPSFVQALLETYHWEGFVWHHPDGRMAKIKRRDYGLPWPDPNR